MLFHIYINISDTPNNMEHYFTHILTYYLNNSFLNIKLGTALDLSCFNIDKIIIYIYIN